MSDRFSDEKFIEAARVYQNIKAPSDLRGKILAAASQAAPEGTQRETAVSRRKQTGKIYRLASLAACLAIMVATLPDWQPPVDSDVAAPRPKLVREQQLPGDVNLPENQEQPDPCSEPEGGEIPAYTEPEPESEGKAEPAEPEDGAAEAEVNPADEPETPEAVSVYTAEPAVQPATADGEEPEQEDFAEKTEYEPTGIMTVSVGKLLPAMAMEGSALQDMEVRLAAAEDGTCTVKIITADSKPTAITVAKNAEDGHWEITGAAEE